MFRRDKILSKISNLGEHKTKKERSDENIMDLLELIQQHKEWIFSGVGVAIVILIGKIICRLLFDNKKEEKQDITIKQFNSGNNSTQIGIQNNYYNEEKDGE